MTDTYPATSTYRLALAHVLRILGPIAICIGAVWIVLTLTSTAGVLGGIAAIATALTVLAGVWLVARPPRVLTLTATGYRVSFVRGADVTEADWTDVEGVVTRDVAGSVSLVLTLADGSTSVVPLSLLGARHVEAQREVHDRLNTAHGYRRLPS